MRGLIALCLLLGSCKNFAFTRENRPCDAENACLAGYVCNVNNRCVREGTAGACQPHEEIACNGVDEDCNGLDLVETGTLENCGGCNDACGGVFVAQSACVSRACTVTRCDAGHVNADGDASNGCERECDNVDGDNVCDTDDTCIDKDGDHLGTGVAANAGCAISMSDSNDADPHLCADSDSDGCNDCTSGVFAPTGDGIDRNGNGLCNVTDTDEDHDGVPYTSDSDDNNPNICQDIDGDGCNDCSMHLGAPSVSNDGADFDNDGLCDAGDPDDDNDTVLDPDDCNDAAATVCQDVDGDGCNDCAKFAIYQGPNVFDDGDLDVDRDGVCGDATVEGASQCAAVMDGPVANPLADCDDGIPTCHHSCMDSNDPDTIVDCAEIYCLQASGPFAGPSNICHQVTDAAALFVEMATPAPPGLPVFILINSDIVIGPTGIVAPSGRSFVFHQRVGAKIRVAFSTPKDVFQIDEGSNGNEFYGLTIEPFGAPTGPTGNIDSVFHIQSNSNIISDSSFNGFDTRGIFIEGTGPAPRGSNIIANNVFRGGLSTQDDNGITTGNIVLSAVTGTRVVGNVFAGGRMSGLNVAASTGLRVDHNTFFMNQAGANDGSGLNFVNTDSTESCAHNNLFFREDSMKRVFAYEFTDNTTWTTACSFGNLVSAPSANICSMEVDTSNGGTTECGGLPAGFFGTAAAPAATDLANTTDPLAQGFMCLKPAFVDLMSYTIVSGIDYNSRYFSGTFNGATPEPGAREHSTPYCP